MGPLIGGGVATLLSLLILSRAVANNPLYRLAQHLLVGVALGYVAAVLVRSVLIPPVRNIISNTASFGQLITLGAGGVLVLMFAGRFGQQRSSGIANLPLALLFGIGAALALRGAIEGTLVPQLLDTIRLPGLSTNDLLAQIGSTVVAVLTITTLLSFMYVTPAQGPSVLERWGRRVARGLILATFGVFFAAAVTTYVAALVGQLDAIIEWVSLVVGV